MNTRCHSLTPYIITEYRESTVVHCIPTNQSTSVIGHLFTCLTPNEQERANRYRAEQSRLQFIVGRGIVRQLLGEKLGLSPCEVPITYSGSGKPRLDSPKIDLHFNVTHSVGLVLIAMADRPIGIDLERHRLIADQEGLVNRFFSSAERQSYERLALEFRVSAFFRGWTCKEAIIKAAGLTIACLDDFDVELHPSRPATLLAARHPELVRSRWDLVAWEPAPGYSAALAVQQEAGELSATDNSPPKLGGLP